MLVGRFRQALEPVSFYPKSYFILLVYVMALISSYTTGERLNAPRKERCIGLNGGKMSFFLPFLQKLHYLCKDI